MSDTFPIPIIKHIGCVKWFNSSVGYGYITWTPIGEEECDVFAHISNIELREPDGFKRLITGEYVSFSLVHTPGDKYKFHAENITGVNNGKLMCESRANSRVHSAAKSSFRPKKNSHGSIEKSSDMEEYEPRYPLPSWAARFAAGDGSG